MADDPDTFAELKVIETKVGRLAMLFSLCYYKQTIVISEGGVRNPHFAVEYGTSASASPCWLPRWLCSLPLVLCLPIGLHGTAPLTQDVVGEHQLKLLVRRE